MEVHMVADVEVDKVADMFADIVAEKGTQLLNLARRRRVPNLVRELVTGVD